MTDLFLFLLNNIIRNSIIRKLENAVILYLLYSLKDYKKFTQFDVKIFCKPLTAYNIYVSDIAFSGAAQDTTPRGADRKRQWRCQ